MASLASLSTYYTSDYLVYPISSQVQKTVEFVRLVAWRVFSWGLVVFLSCLSVFNSVGCDLTDRFSMPTLQLSRLLGRPTKDLGLLSLWTVQLIHCKCAAFWLPCFSSQRWDSDDHLVLSWERQPKSSRSQPKELSSVVTCFCCLPVIELKERSLALERVLCRGAIGTSDWLDSVSFVMGFARELM